VPLVPETRGKPGSFTITATSILDGATNIISAPITYNFSFKHTSFSIPSTSLPADQE
jgi:hypothetical protein